MCKYCEKDKNGCTGWNELNQYAGAFEGDYAEFSICGTDLMFHFLDKHTDETFKTEIAFCPKCGTPLGEVKPLTVEQISELNKTEQNKPFWIAHGKDGLINKSKAILYEIGFNPSDADYVKEWSFGNEVEEYLKIEKYGTDWLAFDREPKGEAE